MPTSTKKRHTSVTQPRRVRSQQWILDSYAGVWHQDGPNQGVWVTEPGMHGAQTTVSEGHDWPPKTVGKDVGGPFSMSRTDVNVPISRLKRKHEKAFPDPQWNRVRLHYDASFATPIQRTWTGTKWEPNWPTSLSSSEEDLNAAGATAIARCKPTSGEAELSTALGELFREGIPSLIGSTLQQRTLTARNAGSDYLNVEFGWMPLVSDATKVARALADADRIVQQYERDQGRLVRRSYSFPTERSAVTEVLSSNRLPDGTPPTPTRGDWGLQKGGVWSKTTTTYKRRWFKGAFVYGSPLRKDNVEASAGLAQKADQLLGLSLTPDVLWNLSPWSWAIDWVTNTGDVLAYASDVMTHGLVMQYGYIMEHTVHEYRYSLTGAVYHGTAVNVPDAIVRRETKLRYGANPFGFGITWNGLSAAQAAILAALGFSRT